MKRYGRCFLAGLLLATSGFGAALASRPAHADPGEPLVTAVERIELVVGDLERSRHFFELLGFEALEGERSSGSSTEPSLGLRAARVERLELALGAEHVALVHYLAPSDGRALPADTHGNDRWFQHLALVVSDMGAAYAWLHAHHVRQISTTPQTLPAWNRGASGIEAFYFLDPDGHPLELIHFPKGKGDPRWQKKPSCTRVPAETCGFLGIDHTAITVADTDQSLGFYRDALGLRVAGSSENYGTEQEHLNGVFGAHLRITALRAKAGPGIELLEYLAPNGGRPAPLDLRPNDLAHVEVIVRTSDTARAWSNASMAHGRGVELDRAHRRALVQDPDAHALVVHE